MKNSAFNRRIPRETGLTEMSILYRQSQNPSLLSTIQNYIVKLYVLNSFSLNKTPISIPSLSQFLTIPLSLLHNKIQSSLSSLSTLINPNNIQESLLSLVGLSMQFSLEDRARALNQYQILSSSQGDTYKPFISSEVSKSIELLMKSNKQIQESLSPLSPKSQTLILNQNNPKQIQESDLITSERALELIQANPTYSPLRSNPKQLQEVFNIHIQDIHKDLNIIEGVKANANTLYDIDNNIQESVPQNDTNSVPQNQGNLSNPGPPRAQIFAVPVSHSPEALTPVNIIPAKHGPKAKRALSKHHPDRRARQLGIDTEAHLG